MEKNERYPLLSELPDEEIDRLADGVLKSRGDVSMAELAKSAVIKEFIRRIRDQHMEK